MSQTSVNLRMSAAIPGMKADNGLFQIDTFTAEANLDIGIGLVEGTTYDDVKTPANVVSQIFKGFSAQSHDRENTAVAVDDAIYKATAPVNVGVLGSFWIQFIDTPTPGDAVILAVSAGNEGKVTDTGGGNTVAATGWKFQKIDTVTGLAQISNRGN